MHRPFPLLVMSAGALAIAASLAARPARAEDLVARALAAAGKAAGFYWNEVSTAGGYVWRYSADLDLREGEERVGSTTVWIQPPGTPSVGEAYVRLYEATGEPTFRDAALAVAEVLRQGQLQSGGWDSRIELAPEDRKRFAYRVDPPRDGARNRSSLDDDKSQSAIRFLIHLDRALDLADRRVHEMVTYALAKLLEAQYPNGAFPHVWDGAPRDEDRFPVQAARYPGHWSRTYPGGRAYGDLYTLNDDLLPDVVRTLILAAETYQQPAYRQAAVRAGDFLLRAQMPDPQPAWAQQYDFQMQPAWARKFEPPAITGGESQGAMRVLMQVYRLTGDKRYLEPIPRALAYLNASRLPNGRLARFYELRTNRPLYFTRSYQLTYDDGDLPTHYAFTVGSDLEEINRQYRRLAAGDAGDRAGERAGRAPDAERIREICEGLDARGAWVTQGALRTHDYKGPILDMRVAVANLNALAAFLADMSSR